MQDVKILLDVPDNSSQIIYRIICISSVPFPTNVKIILFCITSIDCYDKCAPSFMVQLDHKNEMGIS